MQEKENVLKILRETKAALEDENGINMKALSDQTVHAASIYQDPDNIIVAVLVYALSKIIERRRYRAYPGWKTFMKNYVICIDKSIAALEEGNEGKFRKEIKHIRKHINALSGDFRKHIQDVFIKAQVNKASRMYEHGISMQRTADLLGISTWELAEYAGTTGVADIKVSITLPEAERMKIAKDIFS